MPAAKNPCDSEKTSTISAPLRPQPDRQDGRHGAPPVHRPGDLLRRRRMGVAATAVLVMDVISS